MYGRALPTLAELLVLQGYLAQAKAALHKLLLGQSAIEVTTMTDTVKYSRATVSDLRAYIAELEDLIAGREPAGAIGVTWSL